MWLIFFGHWVVRLRLFSHTASIGTLSTTPGVASPVPPMVGVFVAMLLLSPVVNPWYWLWVLPLALLHFSVLTWAAATVSLLAYAHIGTQVLAGSLIVTYAVPLWATGLQILVITLAFALEHRQRGRL